MPPNNKEGRDGINKYAGAVKSGKLDVDKKD